jgi:PAS domain S-box-containing protein
MTRLDSPRAPLGYVLAALAVVIALALRYLLDRWIGATIPLVTLYGAVAAAEWLAGAPSAIAAALVGFAGFVYLFPHPVTGSSGLAQVGGPVGLFAYLFTSSLIVGFGEASRAAQVRARRIERELAGQLGAMRLLASIVQSSDDAIISKTLEGVIETWNPAAERLFGYTAQQSIGRHISLIIPPERLSEEERIIAHLKSGERLDHFETERVRADGGRVIVSLTISPLKDDSGRVVGASKIARDVTRQRQVEQRERQLLAETAAANAKFQAFFEQGALFAGIMDLDGTVIEANRLSLEGCGYTKEQIIGKPFWEGPWWTPSAELVARIEAAWHAAAEGRAFRAEMPYFVASGEERMADVMLLPITDTDGRVLFLAATGVDITERKRAEADREAFFRLVDNSQDFIGMCDLGGIPFFINRAGLALVGLDSLEDARRVNVASFFFPEDQDRIMNEFFPSVLETGRGEVEVRFRNFTTGEARWMSYKVLTLPGSDGRPIGYATVSQDITERKQLEDNLRRLAADLSEADRRKNEFLAMLAHELRNPLAPISNAVRALRLRDETDPNTLRTASEMLERQVAQMARLVSDLLDMSRITRGRIELQRATIELAPVVEQAVEAARPLFTSMQHQLAVSLPAEPVYLNADAGRLAQVIGNLLNNACKFTDKGGHIALTVACEDGEAVITVRDDGIGIAPEHLERLFDMFVQVDTSLERSRDGLGIGLTLVKTLVDLHGGAVEVRSDGVGRGSEFIVRLPALRVAAVADTAASRARMPGGARRVLIVDDSLDGAESLAMLLQFEGHETHTAHDGAEAIKAAERLRPDVVLLDIGLPIMNGYEACRRIRNEPWGKDLLLVALTGWGQEEDRERSRNAGFDMHMVKPVDHDQLVSLLASAPSRSVL